MCIVTCVKYIELKSAQKYCVYICCMCHNITLSLSLSLSNTHSYPRSITVPFLAGEGWGFEVTGGNAVGIFISKVSNSRKELQVRQEEDYMEGEREREREGEGERECMHSLIVLSTIFYQKRRKLALYGVFVMYLYGAY